MHAGFIACIYIASGKEIHLFDANLGKEPYFKISPDGKKLITIG